LREALFVGAVVIDPQIPSHEFMLRTSRIRNGRFEAGVEAFQWPAWRPDPAWPVPEVMPGWDVLSGPGFL
jgi:hypothetical protein